MTDQEIREARLRVEDYLKLHGDAPPWIHRFHGCLVRGEELEHETRVLLEIGRRKFEK